ncbi:hypothetical protein MAM1_0036d02682 [Mucor ambiguus]|uniref:Uncharacterized protein n=1 Tax=Mucor ambiguus TaxID=91626 RepID=A0A0C9LSX2_9FUNG|nr:hypothetical protein MAM1_0036d02682 [Mucor ambiguus]
MNNMDHLIPDPLVTTYYNDNRILNFLVAAKYGFVRAVEHRRLEYIRNSQKSLKIEPCSGLTDDRAVPNSIISTEEISNKLSCLIIYRVTKTNAAVISGLNGNGICTGQIKLFHKAYLQNTLAKIVHDELRNDGFEEKRRSLFNQ